MEGEEKKSGWKIWVYLTPVYILIAIPLVKWTMKINSSDVRMSKDEYSAFNDDASELKKRKAQDNYDPDLTDSGYAVRYRASGAPEGSLAGDAPSREATERVYKEAAARSGRPSSGGEAAGGGYRSQAGQNQANLTSDDTHRKEQMGLGYQKGYLSSAVEKVMGSPKAVGALLNNKYIVSGFMSRGTVKAATASPEALSNYLKGPGPANFLNNPIVKAALNNPAVVSAVATSGIVASMMNTPAAQALMQDPDKLASIVNDNPQLMQMAMQNPQLLSTLMANPDVASQVNKFDTSKIKKY